MGVININELRETLAPSDLYTGTKWLEISGYPYFVHPKTPGGFRRIIKFGLDDSTEAVIYYFPNPTIMNLAAASRSANTYFLDEPLIMVEGAPDIYYVDPDKVLSFVNGPARTSPVVPTQLAFAVPKLQSLIAKMSDAGKEIYEKATLDITAQLLDNAKWVYDLNTLKYASMYSFFKFDLSSLGPGEVLLVIRAVKEFFKDSADEIKTTQLKGIHTLIFNIEV